MFLSIVFGVCLALNYIVVILVIWYFISDLLKDKKRKKELEDKKRKKEPKITTILGADGRYYKYRQYDYSDWLD